MVVERKCALARRHGRDVVAELAGAEARARSVPMRASKRSAAAPGAAYAAGRGGNSMSAMLMILCVMLPSLSSCLSANLSTRIAADDHGCTRIEPDQRRVA